MEITNDGRLSLFSIGAPARRWAAGDRVEFVHQGRKVCGRVHACNRKTVSVIAPDGLKWRVPYGRLQAMDDGDAVPMANVQPPAPDSLVPNRVTPQGTWRAGDTVAFIHQHCTIHGQIKSLNRKTATVVAARGEWRVPFRLLRSAKSDSVPTGHRHTSGSAEASVSHLQPLSAEAVALSQRLVVQAEREGAWAIGDMVSFKTKGYKFSGQIRECHPKRASVEVTGGDRYRVPYMKLHAEDMVTDIEVEKRRRRLAEVSKQAQESIDQHGLVGWRFEWDAAQRRGGVCRYESRTIGLSARFVLATDVTETTDTILHEIAHALVGPGHGHDRVWVAKAKAIGCSAKVTHAVEFSAARWMGVCTECGQTYPRLRRPSRHGSRCGTCGNKLRWRRVTKPIVTKPTVE